MPIASLLLDDCNEVHNYVNGLQKKLRPIESYLVKQPDGKVVAIALCPVFYVFEWAIFNPLFRWVMGKGLKKAGYRCSMIPVNRLELVRLLSLTQQNTIQKSL